METDLLCIAGTCSAGEELKPQGCLHDEGVCCHPSCVLQTFRKAAVGCFPGELA